MTPRQLRLVRGAAASMTATITAAVSHTIGGGDPPHPLLVLALSVLLAPVAAVLVGRTSRIASLTAAVLIAQATFHVLFVALGATLTPGVSTGGHHHSMVLPASGPAAEGIAPSEAMLFAHLVAALLTVAMLWRGEQLLRAIARWARATLRRRILRPRTDCPRAAALSATTHRFVSAVRIGELYLRGPPCLSRG